MDPAQFDPAELARLARLSLDDEEQQRLAGQLRLMIESFNRINSLSTEGVEPFAHSAEQPSAARPDEPSPRERGAEHLTVPGLPGLRQGGRR